MIQTKLITLFLVFLLVFGGLLYAQKEEENREARKIYEKAKASIYQKNWEKAIESLNTILKHFEESEYLDDSLYWLSYSMNKLSSTLANVEMQLEMQKEALHHLDSLIEGYTGSSWVDDAKFLRIEIAEDLAKKGLKDYRKYINDVAKAAVKEATEALEEEATAAKEEAPDSELELKLVALNAFLNLEEDKAFPILVRFIKKEDDPKLRERAVFVLSQKDHPEVLPLMIELATKDPDKKIKETAIFWLGQRRGKESFDALVKIYDQTIDSRLRERLIYALSQNRSKAAMDKLFEIAKREKDKKAREMAIFWLGQSKEETTPDRLIRLYDAEKDPRIKERLVFALSQNKSKKAKEKLVAIIKNEKDKKPREMAVFYLGQRGDEEILNLISDIYFKTDDIELKKRIIFAHSQYFSKDLKEKAVKKMIEMARKEKNVELKKQLIFWLGQSKSEEAMKFLKEILEK